MASVGDWQVPPSVRPKAADYGYDLDRALLAVVGIHTKVPEDAFTAETLGTERMGHGVLIRERGHQPGQKLAGQPYWVLEAREVAEVAVPQEMLNHWGVFVSSQAAVDEAFEKINAQQKEFGLGRVQKPRFRHGSYAFYFVDGDSNWWEIEYRTPELLYTSLRQKGDQVDPYAP